MAVTVLDGASHLLESPDPAIALALNPFNNEARINLVVGQLNANPATDALAPILQQIHWSIQLAPIDARGYSLAGEVRQRQGEEKLAQADYSVALHLSKTEIHALVSTLRTDIEQQSYRQSVARIDLILRRWPQYFDQLKQVFVPILSTRAGYGAFLTAIAASPPWEGQFLSEICKSTAGALLADRLLLDLKTGGKTLRPGDITTVIGGLLRNDQETTAYQLFLLTQTDGQRAVSGYVFDGGFQLGASSNPFAWHWTNRSGYELAALTSNSRTGGGLQLEFFDKPVRSVAISQLLRLPSGYYDLKTVLDGEAVALPKGLYWSLRCAKTSKQIAQLDIPEGTYRDRTLSAQFQIDDNECKLERLTLETSLIAESWQYRYEGRVVFRRVEVENLGLAR